MGPSGGRGWGRGSGWGIRSGRCETKRREGWAAWQTSQGPTYSPCLRPQDKPTTDLSSSSHKRPTGTLTARERPCMGPRATGQELARPNV